MSLAKIKKLKVAR